MIEKRLFVGILIKSAAVQAAFDFQQVFSSLVIYFCCPPKELSDSGV